MWHLQWTGFRSLCGAAQLAVEVLQGFGGSVVDLQALRAPSPVRHPCGRSARCRRRHRRPPFWEDWRRCDSWRRTWGRHAARSSGSRSHCRRPRWKLTWSIRTPLASSASAWASVRGTPSRMKPFCAVALSHPVRQRCRGSRSSGTSSPSSMYCLAFCPSSVPLCHGLTEHVPGGNGGNGELLSR